MRRRAQREFADNQSLARDALPQRAVVLRIEDAATGAEHRNGRARPVQTAAVRRRVYAQCQAADDGEAGGTESARKLFRVAYPLMRGVATAHHGKGGEG